MRFRSAVGLALAGVLGIGSSAAAQDTDQLRGYLQARAGLFVLTDPKFINGVEADRIQDAYGVSVGVNLNRYFGVEIAGDMYEPAIQFSGGNAAGLSGDIAEYKVWTLIPQVRLRYPLLDGRLTPYVLGGVGVSFVQLNDRKPPAYGIALSGSNASVAVAVGLGIEYFLLNNLTVGVEAKYLYAGEHDLRVGSLSGKANPSALLTTIGFRVLWPEATAPDRPAPAVSPPDPDLDPRLLPGSIRRGLLPQPQPHRQRGDGYGPGRVRHVDRRRPQPVFRRRAGRRHHGDRPELRGPG